MGESDGSPLGCVVGSTLLEGIEEGLKDIEGKEDGFSLGVKDIVGVVVGTKVGLTLMEGLSLGIRVYVGVCERVGLYVGMDEGFVEDVNEGLDVGVDDERVGFVEGVSEG